jgi:hypothetical protein
VDKFNKFELSGGKPSGTLDHEVQTEGGFGSRQSDIGCLDSVIEFGPQSFCRRQNNSVCTSIQL